jgi:hypothetical protein
MPPFFLLATEDRGHSPDETVDLLLLFAEPEGKAFSHMRSSQEPQEQVEWERAERGNRCLGSDRI